MVRRRKYRKMKTRRINIRKISKKIRKLYERTFKNSDAPFIFQKLWKDSP
jgi:hypothetical protein